VKEHEWTLQTISTLDDISSSEWNLCANSAPGNPFVSYEFLHALEASKSAIGETGWYTQHLILRDHEDEIKAVVPAYVKNHSQGEYVFDQAWAEAFARAGGHYYPKLQISVPFTPAAGPRLLIRPGGNSDAIYQALDQGLRTLCERHQLSSTHITFMTQEQSQALSSLGWLARTDTQFHWKNKDYTCFDDFLNALSSRKRKNIRKERAGVAELEFTFELLSGDEIKEHHWDHFFAFYQDTGARKWGTPYLTRSFFSLIGHYMALDILLIMVKRDGRYIASALNFIGGDTLYGRYWGTREDHPGLHFETCYYRAIEFAIERKLKTVEAGAQGPHKLARGYEPVTTFSAHYIANESFSSAIEDYLERERSYVAQDNEILLKQAPFRKGKNDEQ